MGGESKDRPESQHSKSTKKSGELEKDKIVFDMESILPHSRMMNAYDPGEESNMLIHHADVPY